MLHYLAHRPFPDLFAVHVALYSGTACLPCVISLKVLPSSWPCERGCYPSFWRDLQK